MLILNTHSWIWAINGDRKIQKSGFLNHIQNSVQNNSLIISSISLWEVAMLISKGRIILTENTIDWMNNASSAPGLSVHPITSEIAYESTVLPDSFHGDPADRLIVATARVLNATLLTFDQEIIKYAKRGYVNIINPKK
jgi:PIN domain nuclease of toxin-antitoxin system